MLFIHDRLQDGDTGVVDLVVLPTLESPSLELEMLGLVPAQTMFLRLVNQRADGFTSSFRGHPRFFVLLVSRWSA